MTNYGDTVNIPLNKSLKEVLSEPDSVWMHMYILDVSVWLVSAKVMIYKKCVLVYIHWENSKALCWRWMTELVEENIPTGLSLGYPYSAYASVSVCCWWLASNTAAAWMLVLLVSSSCTGDEYKHNRQQQSHILILSFFLSFFSLSSMYRWLDGPQLRVHGVWGSRDYVPRVDVASLYSWQQTAGQ